MDTVTLNIVGQPKAEIMEALDQNLIWKSDVWTGTKLIGPGYRRGIIKNNFRMIRKTPHIFVAGSNGVLNKVTAQLPELLHGHNGIQIKCQKQLDDTLDILFAMLREIAEDDPSVYEFSRIDFAYHLKCEPVKLLNSLRLKRHPRIRGKRAVYQSNSIQWTGKLFTVSIYSKQHRKSVKASVPNERDFATDHNNLRIEVQAKNKRAVRELYGSPRGAPVRKLDFEHLFLRYREFLGLFGTSFSSSRECTFHTLLALCHRNEVRLPCGMPVIEWWKQGKQPETIRKDLKKILAISFDRQRFDLQSLLPEGVPDRWIDVHPNCKTQEV